MSAPQAGASRPCPDCGHTCLSDAKFCPKCGHNFVATAAPVAGTAAATEPCPHCAAPVKKGAKFCGKCGKAIVRDQAASAVQDGSNTQPVSKKPTVVERPTAPALVTPAARQPAVQKMSAATPASEITPKKPDEPRSAAVLPSAVSGVGEMPRKRNTPMVAIAGGAAVLAVALGVGGYFFFNKPHETAVDTQEKVVAISPAVPTPVPELVPAATPVSPAAPVDAPSTGQNTSPPAPSGPVAMAPPVTAPPAAARQESPGNQAGALTVAINASLDEGNRCMARKKYDCAIASASTVLRLDPHNARALDMERKAKAAQNKALSQIEIQ